MWEAPGFLWYCGYALHRSNLIRWSKPRFLRAWFTLFGVLEGKFVFHKFPSLHLASQVVAGALRSPLLQRMESWNRCVAEISWNCRSGTICICSICIYSPYIDLIVHVVVVVFNLQSRPTRWPSGWFRWGRMRPMASQLMAMVERSCASLDAISELDDFITLIQINEVRSLW